MQVISIKHRAKNFVAVVSHIIKLSSGTLKYTLNACSSIEDKTIIGVLALRQNASGSRRSPEGRLLLSRDSMSQGQIEFKSKSSYSFTNKLPLDLIAYDKDVDAVGDFAQLYAPLGIKKESTEITFPAGAITADVDLVLVFFLGNREDCNVSLP